LELIAFQFSYKGDESAETFNFYNKYIRGFIRWHRTEVVWIQGSLVKREAYIIMLESLVESFMRMMENSVKNGYWATTQVNVHNVIKEALDLNRRTRGYLRYGLYQVGNPDENYCPDDDYRKVSIEKECEASEDQARCPFWNGWRCQWTWKKTHPSKLKKEHLRDFLAPEDAQNYLVQLRKRGDKHQYEIVEGFEPHPIEEKVWKLYRILVES